MMNAIKCGFYIPGVTFLVDLVLERLSAMGSAAHEVLYTFEHFAVEVCRIFCHHLGPIGRILTQAVDVPCLANIVSVA